MHVKFTFKFSALPKRGNQRHCAVLEQHRQIQVVPGSAGQIATDVTYYFTLLAFLKRINFLSDFKFTPTSFSTLTK